MEMSYTADENHGYDVVMLISKRLALTLPLAENRVIASKWIRKIDSLIEMSKTEKWAYLKLLNISMQSKVLVGPFQMAPPEDDFDISPLYNLKPADIVSMIVQYKHRGDKRGHPYLTEISDDLKEYVVYQEIPEFGIHFYYACSSDPIQTWMKHKNAILPKGAIESSILTPPLSVISKSKEEYLLAYESYLKNLKEAKCNSKNGNDSSDKTLCHRCTKQIAKKNDADAECSDDSDSEYVDYQLIGHGASLPETIGCTKLNDDDLPEIISFYIGDNPEPFHYQLVVDQSNRDKSAKINEAKIKALASEYVSLGVVESEQDAMARAKNFLLRVGCI